MDLGENEDRNVGPNKREEVREMQSAVNLSDLYKSKQELIFLRASARIIPDRLLNPVRHVHPTLHPALHVLRRITQAGSSLSTDLTETAGQSGGIAPVVGFVEKWLIQSSEQANAVSIALSAARARVMQFPCVASMFVAVVG